MAVCLCVCITVIIVSLIMAVCHILECGETIDFGLFMGSLDRMRDLENRVSRLENRTSETAQRTPLQ